MGKPASCFYLLKFFYFYFWLSTLIFYSTLLASHTCTLCSLFSYLTLVYTSVPII